MTRFSPVSPDREAPTGRSLPLGEGQWRLRSLVLAGCLGASVALSGCSGSDSPSQNSGGGTTFGADQSFFFEDPNFGGAATSMRLDSLAYGRLVELTARNANGERQLMAENFVIGQEFNNQSGDWELETNPVTGQQTFFIDRNVDDADERAEFLTFARNAANALAPIQVREVDDPLVSMVPRNAAIVVQFNDLLDPGSVNDDTIAILQGEPPAVPSIPHSARIFPSENFGGTSSNGTFYPTRVIIDLTISEIEATASAETLAVNTLGLRASTQPNRSNTQVRFATRINSTIGVTNVVRNLAGNPLSSTTNGPADLTASTQPVLRPFRSGGASTVILDPFNGFLLDDEAPIIVGSTQVELLDPPQQLTAGAAGSNSRRFNLPRVQFSSTLCASGPDIGDVIVQSGVFAQVVQQGTAPGGDGIVRDVGVRLVSFPDVWDGPFTWENTGQGAAAYETAYDPSIDNGRTECFVRVLPLPTGFPENPGQGVLPESIFTVRFSEPMEPASLTAFDSVTLARDAFVVGETLPSSSFVVGSVAQTQDLRSVTFTPRTALSHQEGTAEPYFLRVADQDNDAFPPEDLAGNAVESFPEISFAIEATAPSRLNGGRVSRFTSIDEEGPEGAEWGGQVLIDSARQLLRPRPVLRGQVVLDNNQPMMALQTFIPGGVVTPHSPFGSRMQTLWRYCDCGFSLTDQQDQSLDIEGLSWRPSGATVAADDFSRFEIRLAHCRRLPDEFIDPGTAWPQYPQSGLLPAFSQNRLQVQRPDIQSELVVHPRERGYTIDTGDLYQGSTGTTLLPFPLNRDDSFDDNVYFTWRDPRVRTRAPSQRNGGTEPRQWFIARGLQPPLFPGYRFFYGPINQCQTIALPLLMEFRVYPDLGAVGQNSWDFNIAANSSARPYFRAFATGGTDTAGSTILVEPDSADSAIGGFNPGTSPAGQVTDGQDNVVHHGAIDYVTRISHAHSIWFEATIDGEATFIGRRFSEPILEPNAGDQAGGTEVRVEYRGATAIEYLNDELSWQEQMPVFTCPADPVEGREDNDGDPQDADPTPGIPDFQVNAFLLDLYGDYYNDSDNFSRTFGDPPGTPPPAASCDTPNVPPLPRLTNQFPEHDSDWANPGLTFLGGDDSWRTSVDQIADSRFYQVRLTFVGNPETGQTAEVSAFALTWTQN
ncbi:MAG: Ig-like domain-containing protein [Planctomycetota bacterium]